MPHAAISTTPPAPAADHRDQTIDAGRGLIVALMALDHVRIFFSSAQFDPTDLDSTNLGWFLTRWVTHLCAPGFFFTAGLAVALMARTSTKAETSRFLIARGIWLIALEILVFGVAWSFNPGWFWLGVIWGLGGAMLLLAALIHLPRWAVFAGAATFTLLHADLAPFIIGSDRPGTIPALLYTGGIAHMGPLGPRIVLYSLLPWAALMVLGYCSAAWLLDKGRFRSKAAMGAGIGAIAIFLVIRLAGIGDLRNEFDAGGVPARAAMSFLNVEKYPPTLQFSLLTIGLVLLSMVAIASIRKRPWAGLLKPLLTFGRVPFFFYLVHIFLIHGLALLVATAAGWPTDYSFWQGRGPNLIPPTGYGVGLIGVYVAWLITLAILFPICRWFARIKRRHDVWWIRYL